MNLAPGARRLRRFSFRRERSLANRGGVHAALLWFMGARRENVFRRALSPKPMSIMLWPPLLLIGILATTAVYSTAAEYAAIDIGSVSRGGAIAASGGYDVTGGGNDIGGTSDQFHFAYQERTGDFDVRVRVADLTISDPFVQAGLMARASLDANSRFAGVFASSPQLGCFLESRATNAGPSQIAAPPGGFPANYPQTWLRLRRTGNQLIGYGGLDGVAWQQLGAATLALPDKILFGMAVSSRSSNAVATAQFRDLSTAANPATLAYAPTLEPLGPSNRRTGLIFSEIMYHPPERPDGKDLEFIEIYNAEAIFVDLTGWRLAGAINYTFPSGFKLEAGEFAVIAADPTAIEAKYGVRRVLGPYDGRLNNAGDTVRLLTQAGAVRLEVEYSPNPPWPVSADGAGHSLVLARPSFGEDDLRAWSASERIGGSPGEVDTMTANPWSGVVINEFLAHTDDPVLDFVEFYNGSSLTVDLSGCFLSDDASTNKFRIPDGTQLAPRSFVSFDQNQLGFALGSEGETIYLVSADRTRVLDAVRFGGQENNVSTGRYPNGAPAIRRLATPTPGTANTSVRVEDVVINEIMYHPVSDDDEDQYVELHNRSSASIDLSGWRFTAGIDFEFPSGARIPARGYVVVAKNLPRLLASHAQLNSANAFGDFGGALSQTGERIVLAKPDLVVSTNELGRLETNTIHIAFSEVAYADGGRWPILADGGGSSLELIDARADLARASNWAASDETQKAPWTSFDLTGRTDLGANTPAANRFQMLRLGAGECLVDDVEIFRVGSTNLIANGSFETGTNGWSFFGNHSRTTLETAGAFAGQACLRVRSLGDGDTGNNAIRTSMGTALASAQTATIRAKVRWLSGWPEMLFRVRGNSIELPVRMEVPKNLGTPGLPNSRTVQNAGPAIFDVNHAPALPRANQPVVVTCRLDDPDNIASAQLRFRVDPAATLTSVTMRDDGTGGDVIAGDGAYSATISGRAAGTLVAFRIEAGDDASPSASTIFPDDAPTRECLIRWGDPIPFGTFAHYHMWSTAATEQARSRSRPFDNTFRDCTLVYGDFRVIYNAGYRDKGSPYHGGSGDYAATVPRDDMLMGIDDRVFGSTGNGGSEQTGMRGDVSAWIAQQMGVPYLHSHFMRLYRNGAPFREILYDMEQPNRSYAQDWFGDGRGADDLYKIAVWFEFEDNNTSFQANGATLQPFRSGTSYKLARYRWNWQPRPSGITVNDYTSIFNLVTAVNSPTERISGLMNLADMEQWMRVFAFNRVTGNWDAWTFNVGQNMYMYTPLGRRAVLMPWDVDFVLGLGNGTSDAIAGGQDPVMNQIFNLPVYRRMLWRAFQDAINGPMQPEKYNPQIDARRAALLKNNVTGLTDPRPLKTYLDGRRTNLQNQMRTNDTPTFAITTSGGAEFTTANPLISLSGTAPLAVATIEVNGIPYPVSWTALTTWTINVPVGAAVNRLGFVGRDVRGQPIAGATDSITVRYTGTVPQAQDWVVINEIMYDAAAANGEFLELHNRHPSVPFDLSRFRINGLGFTFPAGTLIAPNGYAVIVENRVAFARAYGANVPVAGEYSGRLDNNGETLSLIKAGPTEAQDIIIDDVRYDATLPWPSEAGGFGPSLQLIDPAQDNWRVGNWIATGTNDINRATPGRANAIRNNLEPFPALWINEVLPGNQSGATDNFGEREPWIELYNADTAPLDLSGYYLSDDYRNPTKWPFPTGTTLGAGQFLLVWADGETSESSGAALHANFRIRATNGAVALSRLQFGTPAVMDYINYTVTSADRAFGSVGDGEPRGRRLIYFPTPGTANNPVSPIVPVSINEWMANNRSTLPDPADGRFDDWFELYNAGTASVDLSGFYLTDNLTNKTQFRIPDGTIISPGAFRLFWADAEPGQNAPGRDVHTNFRLPTDGGQIGLYAADGALVSGVSFGPQTVDYSEGRLPDASEPPFLAFTVATPGKPNSALIANRPPVIDLLNERTTNEGQTIAFRVNASDADTPPQTLTFALANAPAGSTINSATGEFSWTPNETHGPGLHAVAVRVTDSGNPPRSASRSFNIRVSEVNQPPVLAPIADAAIDETNPMSFRVTATDPDQPIQKLTFSLGAGAPTGAAIDPITGEFTWTPGEEHGPATHNITVHVADSGTPALSVARTFNVVVREINNAPMIVEVTPQSIDEGATLRIPIDARDPDNPPAQLNFALENSPERATIDANSGILTWTTLEADGPRDYNITVRVSEPGGRPSSTTSFLVGVREVNAAPVLEPIPNFTVRANDLLTFTNRASDQDLPPQALTFSTVAPLPQGASLDPLTGIFSWKLSDDPIAGTNLITIRVTDGATPERSAEQNFQIVVLPSLPRITINEIMHRPAAANAEFVELHNHSAVNSADLSGWRLEGYDFVFPSGTLLDPNDYVCVARDASAFRSAYGNSVRVVGNATVNLPADGGRVRLIKPAVGDGPELIVDELLFSLSAPWPQAAASQGASLQVIDPRQDRLRVANWAAGQSNTTNAPVTVIPMNATWKYWQNATSPGATWNSPSFNDTVWPAGGALLSVETANLPGPKTTPLTLGRTTYYFRGRFEFQGNPTGAKLRLTTIIDDGAVFYLNGNEIYRLGMPAGTVTSATFASRTAGDAIAEGPFEVPATGLRQGENVLAVEVHQVNATSSDIVFGAAADLISVSAAAFTPGAPNSVARTLPPFPAIWINEVLPNNISGLADNAGEREPWIELFNAGSEALNLTDWSLTDDYGFLAKWLFPPNAIIAPRGYLLIWADGEPIESIAGVPHANFRLRAESGSVALARVQNGRRAIVDYLGYAVADGQSFGSLQDGNPFQRVTIANPTPAAPNQTTAALEPILHAELLNSAQVKLTWNTKAGSRYELQVTSNLAAPAWRALTEAVATTATHSFVDTIPSAEAERYYRVIVK